MQRFILTLLLSLVVPATARAQRLAPCADNGESSSTRSIRPVSGTSLAVAQVPRKIRDRAEVLWRLDWLGHNAPDPAGGVHVTAARAYRFATGTFYLLRVNNVQTLVSKK